MLIRFGAEGISRNLSTIGQEKQSPWAKPAHGHVLTQIPNRQYFQFGMGAFCRLSQGMQTHTTLGLSRISHNGGIGSDTVNEGSIYTGLMGIYKNCENRALHSQACPRRPRCGLPNCLSLIARIISLPPTSSPLANLLNKFNAQEYLLVISWATLASFLLEGLER